MLTLNVANMLKTVTEKEEEYSDIINNIDGKDYVHGGIAFYGGGYNYSYLDLSQANEATKDFGVYDVAMEDAGEQGQMLKAAAGEGLFRFYLYNKKSSRNLSWQENIKNEGIKMDPVVWEEVS